MSRKWIRISAIGIALLALGACEREGPAEKAGKKIDNAIEQAGDKVEEAADQLEKKTDN